MAEAKRGKGRYSLVVMTRISRTPVLLLALVAGLAASAAAQNSYTLSSPDKRIELRVRTAGGFRYDVAVKGKLVMQDSSLAVNVGGNWLGREVKVKNAKQSSHDQMLEPVVRQKAARIRDNYNELRIETEQPLTVVFRAYNEGVAYRLETSLAAAEVKVTNEESIFRFAGDYTVYYPQEDGFFSHNERVYAPRKLDAVGPTTLASLPGVVDADGIKLAIADADVDEYPGLWLKGTGGNALAAAFPPYPLKETLQSDRNFRVTEAADYIAVTRGTRTYPWRLVGIAEKDGDLITNSMVWLLAKPSQLQDTSWIKPGKVAWDWWNFNNVYGVDFKAGVNTATYKFYIDFAAKYGLEYIILDEGWYKLGNLLDVTPEINMEELMAYAKQKNVGVILWVVAKTLGDQLQPALDQFAKWGVKGIKVDFMQRDDQVMMGFYQEVSREAARRHMLVDFHGAQKPATLTRTWPNLISTEGVKGLENSKWSAEPNPPENVTLPFTRMFLGPMDYTPGSMLNATRRTFAQINDRPMSLGTRCQQLAMYVVFESPLQMLADSPSNYLREPEAMEYLAAVPSVWDETRVLDGKIGEYVVIARRKGQEWYVGAMTNWTARDLELDLGFLGNGRFQMDAYQDGVNAERMASDYKRVKSEVSGSSKIRIHLAAGGGFAARVRQ
jgi:alpha-glucosidase